MDVYWELCEEWHKKILKGTFVLFNNLGMETDIRYQSEEGVHLCKLDDNNSGEGPSELRQGKFAMEK